MRVNGPPRSCDVLTKQDKLPCLYFVFSRRQCEEKAEETGRILNYLSDSQRDEVLEYFDGRIEGLGIEGMPSVKNMRRALAKGVAYHHAGLLPVLKEIVEDLFERRLIQVLYATETFAVGINFPVKSVCFDTVRKFNGVDFRPMTSQEFSDGPAGPAGGIDKEGFVYILADQTISARTSFQHRRAHGRAFGEPILPVLQHGGEPDRHQVA